MPTKKYGNERYWCFIEDGWNGKEVAVWCGPSENERVIARANDKYDAKKIVDALLHCQDVEDKNMFGKKEIAFLEFVTANCIEPYATMASNAILWNDLEAYNKLKADFNLIYS